MTYNSAGKASQEGGQEAFDLGQEGSLIMTDGWFKALTVHKKVGGTHDSKQGAEAETCVLTFGQQGAPQIRLV